ncbi:MAG TPA: recombinase family protein [Edaphobacter sp.]|nr:recombinase family protein [Edaphobacter sp.]
MPQLNLNFTDIPIPETCLWEQLDDAQKRIVIETLARLLVKATGDKHQERPTMTDLSKLKPSHTQRAAYVYIRQSTPGQVEHNCESTARQYALADRACQLGWSKEQVVLIDEDLGLSRSSTDKRSGFARLTSAVALTHVGIVLGLEVSRLARNNADWYRLLELCGITDTLIGDNDGVYHPALFNDRLLLGLNRPDS